MTQDASKIYTRKNERVGILFLDGHLTRGDGDRDVRERVRSLLGAGRRHLIVDLSGVDYVDAAGMGLLVDCQQVAVASGGRLIVAGIRGKVRELLRLAELDDYLEHTDGLEEAIALLSSSAPSLGPASQVA